MPMQMGWVLALFIIFLALLGAGFLVAVRMLGTRETAEGPRPQHRDPDD